MMLSLSEGTGSARVGRALPQRTLWTNVLCLASMCVILAAPFVRELGFYSDDWALLSAFQADLNNNQFGIHTMLRGFEPRPLQGMYLAVLFYFFRLDPLGYHLVNSTVLTAGVLAFYWLLLRMKIDQTIAFAAVVLLIVLPQLSTVRVWYATFQIPLSMLFAMLSLHAQLSFANSGRRPWIAAAAAYAILSIAAYEIFAPLILAFPIWLTVEASKERQIGSAVRRCAALLIAAAVTVALTVIAKSLVTERAQTPDLQMYMKGLMRLVKPDYDWRLEGSLNVFATVEVNLWHTLVGFGQGGAALARGELGLAAVVAGIALAAASLWRLTLRAQHDDFATTAGRTFAIGLAAFVLAHATFLVNSQIMFSPTGMGNRAMVAAAPGVAMMFASLAALAVHLIGPHRRRSVFAAIVSIIVMLGSWRIAQIYEHWAEARKIQQRFIAAAKVDLSNLPAGAAVVVDGVCPYHGPAVIVETWWDSTGALSLALNRAVTADTTTDRLKLKRTGLETSIYGDHKFYRFGSSLYVYDYRRRTVVPLANLDAARSYFADPRRDFTCPIGYVGQGVLI